MVVLVHSALVLGDHYSFEEIGGEEAMTLKSDLESQVKETFLQQWVTEETDGVPAPEHLNLNANHAKDIGIATVLYADLDGSTNMVDTYPWWFSAEIYETFLRCSAQIIRSEGGSIVAYDGDRVMAIFTGRAKNTSAVRCALKIHFAVLFVIQPALEKRYPDKQFKLQHVVGIDTSALRTARIGVKNDNDLVWIGRAANHAAKLTSPRMDLPTWITNDVYNSMRTEVKFHNGTDMWLPYTWVAMDNKPIFGSSYWFRID